jgi:hypothetical protein
MASNKSKPAKGDSYPHEAWQVPGEVPPAETAGPMTDTSPGSAAYKLTGPLAAKIAPERPNQGEGSL